MLAPHLLTLARTPCQEVLVYLWDSPAWVTGVGAYDPLGTVMIPYQRKITSYLLHFNVMLFWGEIDNIHVQDSIYSSKSNQNTIFL